MSKYQLPYRMSYKWFCGLSNATHFPDWTTVWTFQNRLGAAGAKALFDGVLVQLLTKGFIARGGQIIDATLVPGGLNLVAAITSWTGSSRKNLRHHGTPHLRRAWRRKRARVYTVSRNPRNALYFV